MTLSFPISLRFILLCGVSVLVAGCQSAPPTTTASAGPVPLTKVEQENVAVAPDDTLESRVAVLEGKMAQDVEPRLKKIDVIENHFQALSLELKTIGAVNAVAEVKPEPAKAVTKPAVKKQVTKPSSPAAVSVPSSSVPAVKAAKDSEVQVKTLRFGEQKNGGVRIVLDATAAAAMNYDLDNAEGILLIDLPKAVWNAGKPSLPKTAPLLKNAHVKNSDAGSQLIIELAGKAKVLATGRLNPSGSYGHRVYLDLAPTP